MRAQLISIHLTNQNHTSLLDYVHHNPFCFCIHLDVLVGALNSSNQKTFPVSVCSVMWLQEKCHQHFLLIDEPSIIVSDFNRHKIHKVIERFVNHYHGETWDDLCTAIERICTPAQKRTGLLQADLKCILITADESVSLDDEGLDLAQYANRENDTIAECSVNLTAFIGTIGEISSDIFYLELYTPTRIKAICDAGFSFIQHRAIIVADLNAKEIHTRIKNHINQYRADTWDEIGQQLCAIGYWEFENMQE